MSPSVIHRYIGSRAGSLILIGALVVASMIASSARADSLGFTDRHVIVKGTLSKAIHPRPERISDETLRIGNVEIPLSELTARIQRPREIQAAAYVAAPTIAAQSRFLAGSRRFDLQSDRRLSAADENEFLRWVEDGAAEVWAAADVVGYLVSKAPKLGERDADDTPRAHNWLPCESNCRNWVWVERRGVRQ